MTPGKAIHNAQLYDYGVPSKARPEDRFITAFLSAYEIETDTSLIVTKQQADKRVLILERRHMSLGPKQIRDGINVQAPSSPELRFVDEFWTLETIFFEATKNFEFELSDDKNYGLATLKFKTRSGKREAEKTES